MKRKILASALCAVMLVCCAAVLLACDDGTPPSQFYEASQDDYSGDKTMIVYLGDSIAEGILGASPLSLRHEYAYANVLGRRNDYLYYNHSVSGHLTKDLLSVLNNELGYDGARALIAHVMQADIIHVSILGNDLLQDMSMNDVVLEAAQGKYTIIDGIADTAYKNISAIVARIRELNPDATLVFQNVYNPLSENSTLIDQATRDLLLTDAYGNVEPSEFRALGAGILDRLNGVLDRYLEENPGAFYIADARAEFDRIFEEDYERGKSLIYPDYIHPSNEGHAVLADVTQSLLEELGLADSAAALANYKTMRKDLLRNHFYGVVSDVDGVCAAIDEATDCVAVTEIFFRATDGLTPEY